MSQIIEVEIDKLKISQEDGWLQEWIEMHGDAVCTSPHYFYLLGYPRPMIQWMDFRGLRLSYVSSDLMPLLKSLMKSGQQEPIRMYDDFLINTGHKRAACLLFLGYEKIKAILVPRGYKL